jgi:hypothetical protein
MEVYRLYLLGLAAFWEESAFGEIPNDVFV